MSLFLRTLGGLSLDRSDAAPAPPVQRKRLLFLAVLAASGPRGIGRDALTALLWGESAESDARNSVKQATHALRRVVGERAIVTDGVMVRLDPAVLPSDVGALGAALAARQWEQAVAAYDGPFLLGVPVADADALERWVAETRARLARDMWDALRRLTQGAAARADWPAAVRWGERLVALDPLDARATLAYLQALHNAGDRAGAVRHARLHETLVREELGTAPHPDVAALVRVLRESPLADERIAEIGRPPAEGPPPVSHTVTPARPEPDAPPASSRDDRPGATADLRAVRLGGSRPRTRRRWLAGTSLAAAAAMAALAKHGGQPLANATTARPAAAVRWADAGGPPASVVVLPFTITGDSADAALGEGVARLVAAAIDDAATVRAADVGAAVRQMAGADAAPAPAAPRIAERLGAAFYVEGAGVRVGDRLRLTATVRATSRPHGAEATARAEVAPGQLFAGVDSLAVQLLAARAATRPGRLVPSAARTTASLSAFKAFLDGEREFRRGRYGDALTAYQRAVSADSTFALAYYRLAMAADWASEGGFYESALRRGYALAGRLAERERLLVTAMYEWQWHSTARAEHALRRAIELYPDDPEATYLLGEVLYHSGYAIGRPYAEAGPLFARVAATEPNNVEALAHLAQVEIRLGHVALADSLARRVRALRGPADRLANELALMVAMARGDRPRLVAVADSLVERGGDESLLSLATWRIAQGTDSAQLAYAFARRLADRSSNPDTRMNARFHLAEYAALAGNAEAAVARASDPEQPPTWMLGARAYQAALPGVTLPRARLLALADSVRRWADERRPAERRIEWDASGATAGLRGWPLGLLALRLGDTASAAGAVAELDRVRAGPAAPLARRLAQSLDARIAWTRGDHETALQRIEEAMTDAPLQVRLWVFGGFALDRWQRAEWLRALGRPAEALRWYGTLGQDAAGELPFARLAALGAATSHEALGEPAAATRERERAARLARNAPAELR